MAVDATIISADPLRLSACPACGYSLHGLGATGICPECGAAFDRALVVLHGYARGTRAHAGNARPWVAFWMLLWPVMHLILIPSHWGVGLASVGAACGLVGLWFAWDRWRTDAPGLVQVELSDAGCRQIDVARREKEAATLPTPWEQIEKIEIGRTPSRRPSVRITLMPSFRWWQFSRAAVDAEVGGGDEVAYALRERVARWKGVASLDTYPAAPTGGFPVVTKPPAPAG